MATSKFWKRAMKCDHENLSPEYEGGGPCNTPYCSGDAEEHCLDCGVYISKCDCGWCNGMSGWPSQRWRTHYRDKERKRLRKSK